MFFLKGDWGVALTTLATPWLRPWVVNIAHLRRYRTGCRWRWTYITRRRTTSWSIVEWPSREMSSTYPRRPPVPLLTRSSSDQDFPGIHSPQLCSKAVAF